MADSILSVMLQANSNFTINWKGNQDMYRMPKTAKVLAELWEIEQEPWFKKRKKNG